MGLARLEVHRHPCIGSHPGTSILTALQGILPDDILAAEPGAVAPVVLSLQVRRVVCVWAIGLRLVSMIGLLVWVYLGAKVALEDA